MAEIIQPDAFNERFTIYLNTEGEPVQRALHEMTAAEVLLALKWQAAEADKLQAEVEPWLKIGDLIDAGRSDELPAELTADELDAAGARCLVAADAAQHVRRLQSLICAAMPQWRSGSGEPLDKALHRYWPRFHAAQR
jgi:hypothetical protein